MFNELAQSIDRGAIRSDIHVRVASESDVVDDATIHWPAERPQLHFGTLIATALALMINPIVGTSSIRSRTPGGHLPAQLIGDTIGGSV